MTPDDQLQRAEDTIQKALLFPEQWPMAVAKFFDAIGARTWGDLEQQSEMSILTHKGMGRAGLAAIRRGMEARGLTLRVLPIRVSPTAISGLPFSQSPRCGVYFIYCAGRIKIGLAIDVRRRLNHIQTHTPFECELLALIPCADSEKASELERHLHGRFSDLRERGEWFRDAEPLSAYIAALESPA